MQKTVHLTYKAAKRIAIAVVGGTVVLLGIIMIVTPGPGLVGIAVGLAILDVEFACARRWLKRLRETISNRLANNRANRASSHRERVENR
jgi:uncharacterized protein (TIGR02611 family)